MTHESKHVQPELLQAITAIPAPAPPASPFDSEEDQATATKVIHHIIEKVKAYTAAPQTSYRVEVDVRRFSMRMPAVDLVLSAFRAKGYTANFMAERSPNGKREITLSWS